jgi:hypothetical protein
MVETLIWLVAALLLVVLALWVNEQDITEDYEL